MITTHKELANLIVGKKILLMNSLGKDSILCLEWLAAYAYPSEIISVQMEFLAPHPGDKIYKKYLKERYPQVKFISVPNPFDLSNVMIGKYQSPIMKLKKNNYFKHIGLEVKKYTEELRIDLGCDYTCIGRSKYESFDRAIFFNKNGLNKGTDIFPLGLMTKAQVHGLLGKFKLHPVYKTSPGTIDEISYYKMRTEFKRNPSYYKKMLEFYPLLKLDEYRWEKMLRGK